MFISFQPVDSLFKLVMIMLLCILYLNVLCSTCYDIFFYLWKLFGHLGLGWDSTFSPLKLMELFFSFNSFSLSGSIFRIKLKSLKGRGVWERKCKCTTWLSSEQHLQGRNHENDKYEFNKRWCEPHWEDGEGEWCVRGCTRAEARSSSLGSRYMRYKSEKSWIAT